MKKKSFRDLTAEEQDFIAQGKPKPLQAVAKEGPAAPAKEPTQLVAY